MASSSSIATKMPAKTATPTKNVLSDSTYYNGGHYYCMASGGGIIQQQQPCTQRARSPKLAGLAPNTLKQYIFTNSC
jgi:hypothetical protein